MSMISDRRNFTFIDGVSVIIFVLALSVLNLILTLLESWTSSTQGYGLMLGLILFIVQLLYWKNSLEDDTLHETADHMAPSMFVLAIWLFILSEVFVFFGFFWIVVYTMFTDFTIELYTTGYWTYSLQRL